MSQAGDRMRDSPAEMGASSRATGSLLGPVQRVDSPEQVWLELEIAGPMSRAFAFGIDYLLILLLTAMSFLVLVSGVQQALAWAAELPLLQELFARLSEWVLDPGSTGGAKLLRGVALSLSIWMLLDLVLTTLYFVAFETLGGGRTPGKRMTQLRVVREDGTDVGVWDSLLRNLLRAVDALPAGYLVGLIAIVFSPKGQRLGDLVAGTLVIRERASLSDEEAEEVDALAVDPDVEAGFRFSRDELAAVGESERRLIRRTLRRTARLSSQAARPLLERAVTALIRRIGRREPVPVSQRRDFLVSLLQASERLR